MEDEEGHVHHQAFFIEWVPHFCQRCQALRHICDESSKVPKNIHVVKTAKKSTNILPFGPKQGTNEQIMSTGEAGSRSLGRVF